MAKHGQSKRNSNVSAEEFLSIIKFFKLEMVGISDGDLMLVRQRTDLLRCVALSKRIMFHTKKEHC